MAEAMHPIGTAGPGSTPGATGQAGQASPAAKAARRPGIVTFAAAMLFLAAGFSGVWAIVTLAQPEWLSAVYSAYGFSELTRSTWPWAFLDLLVGAIAICAGLSVLRGGAFAQILGLSIAGFSAMRWFFFLPMIPWVATTIIVLDVIAVYGLVTRSDYFDTVHLQ